MFNLRSLPQRLFGGGPPAYSAMVLALSAIGLASLATALAVYGMLQEHRVSQTAKAANSDSVRGVLRASGFAHKVGSRDITAPEPLRHSSVFVRAPGYDGMEDNDIRGFLDGRFAYQVNQAGQTHVRLGRARWPGRYGEHELLRLLQRWP